MEPFDGFVVQVLDDQVKCFYCICLRYMVNGLEWCGQISGSKDGMNYNTCPRLSVCDRMTPFWGQASITVGEQCNVKQCNAT